MIRTTLALLILPVWVLATDPYPRNPHIDVKHYQFQLALNDSTDRIQGEATITLFFRSGLKSVAFDLMSVNADGKGMQVTEVTDDKGNKLFFQHRDHRIKVDFTEEIAAGETRALRIVYNGIPADGLIISRNKFNERTFFGDNWPDRARHWLPGIDHPYDKAHIEFKVIVPEHYQVVATGKKIEETNLPRQQKLTHYREDADVALKVATIGVARFAVQLSGEPANVPVTTWVYPQNRTEGFSDFAVAPKVLQFFQEYLAPFPYSKLAHVQSKTRYGGLENAGNIFYFENSVNGKNEREGLIAHETAHQWFGNSASENDWHHVWLSEGFATYLTAVYLENTYGEERLMKEMQQDRMEVLAFYKKNQRPIIDTTITNINQVLSTNTYQKAGWVLHMLRHQVGSATFHQILRAYYNEYAHANATTADFQRISSAISGQNLDKFFRQWLYRGGHPQLQVKWRYVPARKEVLLDVLQAQAEPPFQFPLQIGIKTSTGQIVENVAISDKKTSISIPCPEKPVEIVLDPYTVLLFEGTVTGK